MTGRRTIVGLCMFCAMLFSAVAAQSAMAINGTTSFTCKKESGPTGFSDAHCKSPVFNGSFQHVAIPQDTPTPFTETNNTTGTEKSTAILKATAGGSSVELQATTVVGEGTLTNKLDASGEHYVEGNEGDITYTGVTVTKPAGAGCKVLSDPGGVEGKVTTEPLISTTTGAGDGVIVKPATPPVFAHFTISGCTGAFTFLNKTWTVEGSLKEKTEGATKVANHAEITAQETLLLNGSIVAGLTGSTTTKNTLSGSAITTTTVTT